MTEPALHEIAERLVAEFGYGARAAEQTADDLLLMGSPVREMFLHWWHTGETPSRTVEGFSIESLQQSHGLKVPAAFVTLDWLLEDPEAAKAALNRRFDSAEQNDERP